MAQKVVLICDPGIDGAFAIAIALCDPQLDVVGLLATPGNVEADRATKNARIVLDQIDPARWPRLGAAPDQEFEVNGKDLHGPNGLGNTDFPCASLHHLPPSEKLLVELARQHPNELTVICMGPATVLARAFDHFAELPRLLKRIVLVGGSLNEPGNAGPVSEFHFFCDPFAAKRVLHCDAPVTLVPLDMMRQVLYSPSDLLGADTEVSPVFHFLRQIIPFGIAATSSRYGIEGFHLKDVLGIAVVALPEAATTKMMSVDVEVNGDLTRGMSVFDRRSWRGGQSNVSVLLEIDQKVIRQYVKRTIGY